MVALYVSDFSARASSAHRLKKLAACVKFFFQIVLPARVLAMNREGVDIEDIPEKDDPAGLVLLGPVEHLARLVFGVEWNMEVRYDQA